MATDEMFQFGGVPALQRTVDGFNRLQTEQIERIENRTALTASPRSTTRSQEECFYLLTEGNHLTIAR